MKRFVYVESSDRTESDFRWQSWCVLKAPREACPQTKVAITRSDDGYFAQRRPGKPGGVIFQRAVKQALPDRTRSDGREGCAAALLKNNAPSLRNEIDSSCERLCRT